MKLLKGLYVENRFFVALGAVVALLALGFKWKILLVLGQFMLLIVLLLVVADVLWLFNKRILVVSERLLPRLFSLGDENLVTLFVRNKSAVSLHVEMIDELPYQLQKRDFSQHFTLKPNEEKSIKYHVRPVLRGEYNFGHTVFYVHSRLHFVSRRINASAPQMVAVYPSILQMKKFQLAANSRLSQFFGVKKLRRIGHSYEFEQIKNYAQGDDYRSLNWKATSRQNDLMVNQFQDERSQPVYCIIDKSRQMRLPFNGLSLMDYAINTSLVISNVALQKKDRAGLISFSNKIETVLKAENKTLQLKRILEKLYNEEESTQEANFELLYKMMKSVVRTRSLLILFTNLESRHSLERIKPILKRLASFHLLLVVFFENTELAQFGAASAEDVTDAYLQSAALRMIDEKKYVTQELKQHGVHTVFTAPEDLSINTLNKYLEFKSRGLI